MVMEDFDILVKGLTNLETKENLAKTSSDYSIMICLL